MAIPQHAFRVNLTFLGRMFLVLGCTLQASHASTPSTASGAARLHDILRLANQKPVPTLSAGSARVPRPQAADSSESNATSNPITVENEKTGTRDWTLWGGGTTYVDDDFANGRPRPIQGYTAQTSVNKGEAIDFKISVAPARNFYLEIYRMGYYQGNGGRLVKTVEMMRGSEQPPCPMEPGTGMVECHWSTTYTLSVPNDWTSGIYFAKAITEDRAASWIVFLVRDDARTAKYLYQQPIATYQAYNRFPATAGQAEGTGRSLYDAPWAAKADRVSFNRPYAANGGFSEYGYGELNLVKWLEQQGYDITYATDIDTHVRGVNFLTKYKAFISAGHNEYWTREMRDAVEAARDARVNLAFMGANVSYWQVRLEPDANNVPNRRMVGYKGASRDPVGSPKTDLFRSEAVNRPEQSLVGIQYGTWNTPEHNTNYIVQNSQSWVYAGTGLRDGDTIKDLVGDEVDRVDSGYPKAASTEFTILSDSYFRGADYGGIDERQNSVIFKTSQGGWVFSTGSIAWPWGLNYDSYSSGWEEMVSPLVQKIASNVFDCFGTDALCPKPLTADITGTGKITSSPIGIDCGSDCVESFAKDTWVTLTAEPLGATQFAGWSNACARYGMNRVCQVKMSEAQTVVARFRRSRIRGRSLFLAEQQHKVCDLHRPCPAHAH